MDAIERHLRDKREEHLAQLKSLLSIQSISALSEHKQDIRRAAQFLKEALTDAGFQNAQLMETAGHPVVYGEWLGKPGKPTVLVYGHYDVQPVDPLHLWQTPPFEPDIRDNQIYARGASDDKGPTFLHIKALEAILQEHGELPVNVKFCIEGEEEVGSAHLEAFLNEHQAQFQADLVLISDTTMLAPDQPSICYGLRGLAACQIDLKTANSDLHSGLYGGAVPNAVHALVELLDTLHAPDGTVTVEGFYDDVIELSPEERAEYAKLPHDDESYRKSLGLSALHGEPGYTTLERLWARPTLELNGIYGGFQGEGTKTVIPNEAHAKVTCRLVPGQDPNKILDLIEAHIQKHTPVGATVTFIRQDGGHPYLAPYDHPAIQLAADAYTHAYGVKAVFTRMGGSIPVVETFSQLFHKPVVLMGFSLGDENFHAPNEHFSLTNFDKGLRTLCYYYLNLPTALNA
ncbi:peptidase M20 [Alicyclobacillus acidoterrestris]|uniref:dipeptidase n=1 Tax=Alicyclobacillus suci TaxID=2816080 RepID=UPI00119788DC|nr:dipeptidase [Alicyclobacillus suci]GEO26052.1 peptidase M20 [Alicyclobacillus acidoterrestris]